MREELVPGQMRPGGAEQLKAILENYRASGVVWGVTLDCGPDGCAGAKAMTGQKFPLSDPPSLPRHGCDRSPCCDCGYMPVLEDEAPAAAQAAPAKPQKLSRPGLFARLFGRR